MRNSSLLLILLLLLCLTGPAAGENRSSETTARWFMTESLNLDPESILHWTCEEQVQADQSRILRLSDPEDPLFRYTLNFSADGRVQRVSTPFEGLPGTPGEGALRGLLRECEDAFSAWGAESAGRMAEKAVIWLGETAADLPWSSLSASEALDCLFDLAFGQSCWWTPGIFLWRDRLYASFHLLPAPDRDGTIRMMHVHLDGNDFELLEFLGVCPDRYRDCLREAESRGWTLICGACRESLEEPRIATGLLLMEKDGEEMLAMLVRQGAEDTPRLLPLPRHAIRQNTPARITCLKDQDGFALTYTAGQRYETFLLAPTLQEGNDCLCRMLGYSRSDPALMSGLCVVREAEEWLIRKTGAGEITLWDYADLPFMAFLDTTKVSAFPTTRERMLSWTLPMPPEGQVYLTGAHLYGDSAYGNHLGFLYSGTLCREQEVDHDMMHVRLPCLEGWVDTFRTIGSDPSCTGDAGVLLRHPLKVGCLLSETVLRENTGLFAGALGTYPEGTTFYVLMRRSGNLLIGVTDSLSTPYASGITATGWIPASQALLAPSESQLLWLTEVGE